jgi:oligopeptide transporter 2
VKKIYIVFYLLFFVASAKPFSPPPLTQSQYGSETDIHANKTYGLPRSAYFIIFVEGCERFCFYGLKTILLLYFMQFLLLDKDSATVGYHLFSSACYFTPVLGAIISDGFIGRYWTIVSLSIIYFIGTFVLTITAIPPIGGKKLYV